MFGTDLGFSYDITVLASDVDGKLGLVLVDSKIQHWRSPWVKVVVVKPTIAYARPLCVLAPDYLLSIMVKTTLRAYPKNKKIVFFARP